MEDGQVEQNMRAWPSGIVQELTNVAPKQFLTIKEPSRLKAEYLQASAGLSLTVIGWAGPAYSLESSIDFMTWVSVVSLTNQTGKIAWTNQPSAQEQLKFFRAREL